MYATQVMEGTFSREEIIAVLLRKKRVAEIKAESIANLIINCPEYSRLKELALNITNFGPYEAGEGLPEEYFSELGRCFPTLDLKRSQLVNTGTKIPFYGRTKNSAGGFITGHSADIYLPLYIAQKIQEPGYKY